MTNKNSSDKVRLDLSTENGLLTVIGAVALLSVLCALGIVAAGGWASLLAFLNSQASNWIQALATFVGLMAAYQMGQSQIKADRLLERERRSAEQLRQLVAIRALLDQAERAIQIPLRTADTQQLPASAFWRTIVEGVFTHITKIDLFQCPSVPIMRRLVTFQVGLTFLLERAEDYYAKKTATPAAALSQEIGTVLHHLRVEQERLQAALKVCDEEIAALRPLCEAT